ncbi:MAG TPA: hypothetical protein DCL21_02915 [Alphaproteobacteria bacterium]|nr:hypothetical protein [Alphaproteobacteria bacterium]
MIDEKKYSLGKSKTIFPFFYNWFDNYQGGILCAWLLAIIIPNLLGLDDNDRAAMQTRLMIGGFILFYILLIIINQVRCYRLKSSKAYLYGFISTQIIKIHNIRLNRKNHKRVFLGLEGVMGFIREENRYDLILKSLEYTEKLLDKDDLVKVIDYYNGNCSLRDDKIKIK